MKTPEFRSKNPIDPKQKEARQKLLESYGLDKRTSDNKLIAHIEKDGLPTDQEFQNVMDAVKTNQGKKSNKTKYEKKSLEELNKFDKLD